MGDLVPVGEVIDGEIVDDLCGCGKPGQFMACPYAEEVNNETVMVVYCEDCEQEAADAIWPPAPSGTPDSGL